MQISGAREPKCLRNSVYFRCFCWPVLLHKLLTLNCFLLGAEFFYQVRSLTQLSVTNESESFRLQISSQAGTNKIFAETYVLLMQSLSGELTSSLFYKSVVVDKPSPLWKPMGHFHFTMCLLAHMCWTWWQWEWFSLRLAFLSGYLQFHTLWPSLICVSRGAAVDYW